MATDSGGDRGPGAARSEARGSLIERSQKRRERILDAAAHVFSRAGYRDAAVDDIAREAETSKGGIYFHFPTKESIFIELIRSTAERLVAKVEREVAREADPVLQADAAIFTVLRTFAGHRSMARLLLVDALGAGRPFRAELLRLHERFGDLIAGYLDRAVADGVIAPLDTRVAGAAWFGAIHEVVLRWLVADRPPPLETAYPTLRLVLLRSVGVPEARLAELPER
ncbi:MAG TPA: TetR/AcrR family transcriptional regulator [Candidatus Binatia bacterium]|nr:TetR/AcrR family transcriptional regulator [Candidatus Binatia bacterium]